MHLAEEVAQKSKDSSTKCGAIIVDPQQAIISTGYNGFPRLVNDDIKSRYERPEKYQWTEHAERNAIYNAARRGVPTEGCTIYITGPSCTDCTRAIIQTGILCVVMKSKFGKGEHWEGDFAISQKMFSEAGVLVIYYDEAESG